MLRHTHHAPVLMCAALIAVAATPSAEAASCKRTGARTLASSAEVRVFERGRAEEERVYACSRRTGRSTFLGEDSFPHGGKPEGFRIRGRFVAYSAIDVQSNGDLHLDVLVVDVRRRRRTAAWGFQSLFQDVRLRVRGARLKPDGSFAFLVGATDGEFVGEPPRPGDPAYSVHVKDEAGQRVLDEGEDVDPRSFRATDRSIEWIRGGVRKRASFR